MIVLKWQKYGSLWSYSGIPVYIGGRLITKSRMVWWWPWNWVVIAAALPFVVWRMLRKRIAL